MPPLGEFSPKLRFHIGLASLNGVIGKSKPEKTKLGFLIHPALESAGREPGEESACGKPPEIVR